MGWTLFHWNCHHFLDRSSLFISEHHPAGTGWHWHQSLITPFLNAQQFSTWAVLPPSIGAAVLPHLEDGSFAGGKSIPTALLELKNRHYPCWCEKEQGSEPQWQHPPPHFQGACKASFSWQGSPAHQQGGVVLDLLCGLQGQKDAGWNVPEGRKAAVAAWPSPLADPCAQQDQQLPVPGARHPLLGMAQAWWLQQPCVPQAVGEVPWAALPAPARCVPAACSVTRLAWHQAQNNKLHLLGLWYSAEVKPAMTPIVKAEQLRE